MTTTNTSKGKSSVTDRIKKLLALTVNPNPNEAAAAAAKVQEMLDEHNLTMADIGDWTNKDVVVSIGIEKHSIEYSGKNHPLKRWKENLAMNLCYFNNCKVFVQGGTHLIFVGETVNVEGVMSLWSWLVSQLEVAAVPGWAEYKERCEFNGAHREDPLVFRNSFFSGANDGIYGRLSERKSALMDQAASSMTAIAVRHSEAVNDWILENMTFGKAKKVKQGKFDQGSFAQGKVVGTQVNLGDGGSLTG